MTGGGIPTTIEQRLQQLERDDDSTRRLLEQLANRSAAVSFPRHIWIAKTANDGGGYPAAGSDTFGVIFQDGSYSRTAGSPAVTYANRSASVLEYAKSLAGNYYSEGTFVAVFEEDRQYWIADSGSVGSEVFAASMSRATTQTVTKNTTTTLLFALNDIDDPTGFADQANDRFVTPDRDGWIILRCRVEVSAFDSASTPLIVSATATLKSSAAAYTVTQDVLGSTATSVTQSLIYQQIIEVFGVNNITFTIGETLNNNNLSVDNIYAECYYLPA